MAALAEDRPPGGRVGICWVVSVGSLYERQSPADQESLELWTPLTWLACDTTRIEFGPLVTPFSFRHPAFTARMASAVDDLSNGHLALGLGAGWHERGMVVGNSSEVREQLQELEQVGVERVMLQWLDLDDLKGLEALAKAILQ